MIQSKTTKALVRLIVRPTRIFVFIALLFWLYLETHLISLVAIMAIFAITFDIVFIMLQKQYEMLEHLTAASTAAAEIFEAHEVAIKDLEEQVL